MHSVVPIRKKSDLLFDNILDYYHEAGKSVAVHAHQLIRKNQQSKKVAPRGATGNVPTVTSRKRARDDADADPDPSIATEHSDDDPYALWRLILKRQRDRQASSGTHTYAHAPASKGADPSVTVSNSSTSAAVTATTTATTTTVVPVGTTSAASSVASSIAHFFPSKRDIEKFNLRHVIDKYVLHANTLCYFVVLPRINASCTTRTTSTNPFAFLLEKPLPAAALTPTAVTSTPDGAAVGAAFTPTAVTSTAVGAALAPTAVTPSVGARTAVTPTAGARTAVARAAATPTAGARTTARPTAVTRTDVTPVAVAPVASGSLTPIHTPSFGASMTNEHPGFHVIPICLSAQQSRMIASDQKRGFDIFGRRERKHGYAICQLNYLRASHRFKTVHRIRDLRNLLVSLRATLDEPSGDKSSDGDDEDVEDAPSHDDGDENENETDLIPRRTKKLRSDAPNTDLLCDREPHWPAFIQSRLPADLLHATGKASCDVPVLFDYPVWLRRPRLAEHFDVPTLQPNSTMLASTMTTSPSVKQNSPLSTRQTPIIPVPAASPSPSPSPPTVVSTTSVESSSHALVADSWPIKDASTSRGSVQPRVRAKMTAVDRERELLDFFTLLPNLTRTIPSTVQPLFSSE